MNELNCSRFRVLPAFGLIVLTFLGVWAPQCLAGPASSSTSSQFNVKVKLIPAAVAPPVPPNPPNPPKPAGPPIIPPGIPVSAFCTKNNIPSAHGAIVTVVCTTGAVVDIEPGNNTSVSTPMHGGSYRYVTYVTPTGDLRDTADPFGGLGTTTAWRVVHSSERDYLEMTLGW